MASQNLRNEWKMPTSKVPYGKPVKLLIDFQGFPDGRLVQFEIWRREGQKEEKVSEVYGVTKGGKGIGLWTPQPPQVKERKTVLPLEEKISQQLEEEKYYFIAKIDDKEAKSADMVFTYALDIYLEDEAGKPIDEAEYTITFSDGSTNEGVFKNGHAKIKEAPQGKFKIELKNYEFLDESLGSANSITGKVLDPSGKPISGATVTITRGNREYKLQTNEEGVYRLDNVPPGKYTLTVEAKGFATVKKEGEVS